MIRDLHVASVATEIYPAEKENNKILRRLLLRMFCVSDPELIFLILQTSLSKKYPKVLPK